MPGGENGAVRGVGRQTATHILDYTSALPHAPPTSCWSSSLRRRPGGRREDGAQQRQGGEVGGWCWQGVRAGAPCGGGGAEGRVDGAERYFESSQSSAPSRIQARGRLRGRGPLAKELADALHLEPVLEVVGVDGDGRRVVAPHEKVAEDVRSERGQLDRRRHRPRVDLSIWLC